MHHRNDRRFRGAFTLIELLVVIAIIAVLIGLLLPAVQKVRESASRAQCSNNLHQLALAIHAYENVNRSFPPSYTITVTTNPLAIQSYAWGVLVLPYVEQDNLYRGYQFNQLLNSPANAAVVSTPLKVMQCPSTPNQNRLYTFTLPANAIFAGSPKLTWTAAAGDYIPPSGVRQGLTFPASADRHGLLNVNFNCRTTDVRDGLANTILVAELAGRPDVWRAGGLSTLNPAAGESTAGAGWGDPLNGESWFNGSLYDGTGTQGPCPINCTNLTTRGLYAFHTNGTNVTMGDGSVRFLSASIDPATFAYLITRSGGEVVPGNY